MTKVYIGNLPINVKERELDDLFYKFGRIRFIDIKAGGRPPAFAFVEFEDPRDAEEAVRRRDGVDFLGNRIRVEVARGGTGMAREQFRPPRSSGYRVLVKGLPHNASWQDLKDFIRKVCTPTYADVTKDRDGNSVGVVEFENVEDMRAAIRKLDDSEFRNPRYDAGVFVRLVEDGAGGGGDRGRDSRGGRSRSRSPPRRARSGSPVERDRERDARDDYRGRGDLGRDARDARDGGRDTRDVRDAPARSRSRSRSRGRD